MARASFQNRGHAYPKAKAATPHRKALNKFPPLEPPEEKRENTMSAMHTAIRPKKMLQSIVKPRRNRLLRNTTGVARYISIWEVMPAPGPEPCPGTGNPVVLISQ